MGVFAASALTFMLAAELGGFWVTGVQVTLILVGTGICGYSMARSVRNAWRFGLLGWTRPRWWFELGSIVWMVAVLNVSFLLFAGAVPGNLRVWLNPFGDAALGLLRFAFAAGIVLPTVGYAFSLLYRRKPSGRAHACVSFFFGLTVFIAIGYAVVPQGGFVEGVALAFLALAGVAALLAVAITVRERLKQRSIPYDP
jgi:hypothetical protein